jgi:hypothetical protein
MGLTALLPLRRKLCHPRPRPGLNPRTLGPVASTLTTSPPRATSHINYTDLFIRMLLICGVLIGSVSSSQYTVSHKRTIKTDLHVQYWTQHSVATDRFDRDISRSQHSTVALQSYMCKLKHGGLLTVCGSYMSDGLPRSGSAFSDCHTDFHEMATVRQGTAQPEFSPV